MALYEVKKYLLTLETKGKYGFQKVVEVCSDEDLAQERMIFYYDTLKRTGYKTTDVTSFDAKDITEEGDNAVKDGSDTGADEAATDDGSSDGSKTVT